jgi:hypothetical protein
MLAMPAVPRMADPTLPNTCVFGFGALDRDCAPRSILHIGTSVMQYLSIHCSPFLASTLHERDQMLLKLLELLEFPPTPSHHPPSLVSAPLL